MTPGDSAIDSLEMSIGDLEQKELAARRGDVSRPSLSPSLSPSFSLLFSLPFSLPFSPARIHLPSIGVLTLHVCDRPPSDFLRGARASKAAAPIAVHEGRDRAATMASDPLRPHLTVDPASGSNTADSSRPFRSRLLGASRFRSKIL